MNEQSHQKPSLVQSSLNAHSVIGLAIGALLYILCLSGTIAVVADMFERWEQPLVEEYAHFSADALKQSVLQFAEQHDADNKNIYVVLPNEFVPRAHLNSGGKEWYLNYDGSLSTPVHAPWTEMLKNIHYYLHLPHTYGLIIVSALGALMLGLIVSGILAHPKILSDAFHFRLDRSERVKQMDIHNRLSVWGLPFHIMISLTGAIFGLIGVLVMVATSTFYSGTQSDLINDIYGADPKIENAPKDFNFAPAFDYLEKNESNANPIYVSIHKYGSDEQFFEVAATVDGKLSYSEMFRFEADGTFINQQGLTNGPIARQALYSIYRLHFGQYGGILVRLIYIALGLSLTVVCCSGINIWLEKRRYTNQINALWTSLVWGAPIAFTTSLIFSFLFSLPPFPVFLLSLMAGFGVGLKLKLSSKVTTSFASALGALLILLPTSFFIKYIDALGSGFMVRFTLILAFISLALTWLFAYNRKTSKTEFAGTELAT